MSPYIPLWAITRLEFIFLCSLWHIVYTCVQQTLTSAIPFWTIDEQKALKRDHINTIENTDLEKGVSGVYLQFL